jgi:hypothetical protein
MSEGMTWWRCQGNKTRPLELRRTVARHLLLKHHCQLTSTSQVVDHGDNVQAKLL